MTPQQFVAKWSQIQQKENPTRVARTAVLDWFGGADGFVDALQTTPDEQSIAHLLTDNE